MEWLLKNRYGSLELSRQMGPNLLRGLAGSVMLHGLVVATFVVMALLNGGKPAEIIPLPPPSRIVPFNPFRPLPPIRPELVKPTPPNPGAKPIPTIDDPPVDPTAPLNPTKPGVPGPLERPGTYYGSEPVDTGPIEIGDPGEPIPIYGTFIPHEYEPRALESNPQPAYPELAKISGVAGLIRIQVYVDKHGDVLQWQIVQANPRGLGFEDEVVKVIPKWKFTPAIQDKQPVGLWVTIPFKFTFKR
jgi:protein TonB